MPTQKELEQRGMSLQDWIDEQEKTVYETEQSEFIDLVEDLENYSDEVNSF